MAGLTFQQIIFHNNLTKKS